MIYRLPLYQLIVKSLDREMVRGHAEALVLALLANGQGYGYQLRKDLALRSKHYFQFSFGSLYPTLRMLEKRGLARARWVKPRGARDRKSYVITAKGRAELEARKRKWRQFSNAMERVLSQS
jgi:DNA-binding PadR family transcriptional regulator